MKDHAKTACHRWIARFLKSRSGSIAPLFAVAAIPLTIAIGSATDIGRMMDIRSQMQDIADSAALAGASQIALGSDAAGVTTATNFVTSALATLPGIAKSGISVSASCSVPTAGAVGTVTANVCDLGQGASGTATTGKIKVMLASSAATTFAAIVTPSIAINTQAIASANVGRNVVFTLTNYNSSASDTDQIYYYTIPNSTIPTSLIATNATTNAALLNYYTWTPWGASAPPASNLLLSNSSGFPNTSKTVQVPLNTTVGFAMSNTTGTSNCYGQAMGANKMYYTHREDPNGNYWDMAPAKFNVCTSSSGSTKNYYSYQATDSYGNILLMPCSYTSNYSNYYTCLSSSNISAYNSNGTLLNYVYKTDVTGAYKSSGVVTNTPYSRNPLRFASSNTDCTKGDVIYQWDDNGGNPDDNDYNDDDFTVNCSTTGADKSSVKLVS